MTKVTFNFGKGYKLTYEGQAYLKRLNELLELEVATGFQEGQSYYKGCHHNAKGEPDDSGADTLEVAMFNEFGTSTIPARPFMKSSFDNHQTEIQQFVASTVNGVALGALDVRTATNRVGVYMKGLIQEEIVNGNWTPNAPSTIKKKGSSQPLIDSGHMRQSVQYVVRKAGTE